MATMPSDDSFQKNVQRLRSEYMALKGRSNICPPLGKLASDVLTERIEDHIVESFWYADGDQFVRLHDIPGTLSGDILRLHQNLPAEAGHFEIFGNVVRPVQQAPPPPVFDDDSEDISAMLALLPEVQVQSSVHFTKKGKYRSEIENLLKCQGGSCPGSPISPHLTRLLGKSRDGELVFEKLSPRYLVLGRFCSIAIYKRWLLHLIAGLQCLHSLGIVHRDLHIENLLFSADGQTLVIADLESRWGQRAAPEIKREDILDSGWTEKSDIYDIGTLIKCIIYANIPITLQVEWPIPPPFDHIVTACMQPDPSSRPELHELQAMVEEIPV